MRRLALLVLSVLLVAYVSAFAEPYQHDRFNTEPKDVVRTFEAYTVSFDSLDDNNGDGTGEALGVPEFVAYEIRKYDGECIPTGKRPKWFSDKELAKQGIAPKDNSYAYPRAWRKSHPDWYVRGHLCMKLIAERLGNVAAYNTHTMLNAVPQRDLFNRGIWLDLEELTAAWAQRYGRVWIITGPVYVDGSAIGWIGEADTGELPVAIPEALFKVVVRIPEGSSTPDVLAFLYPQIGPGYTAKSYEHERYLTSVDEIEKLTGLDFLTMLPDNLELSIEKKISTSLWPADKEDFIHACRKKK